MVFLSLYRGCDERLMSSTHVFTCVCVCEREEKNKTENTMDSPASTPDIDSSSIWLYVTFP